VPSTDAPPDAVWGALLGFSQQFFELCEDLFDRIEVWRILRQEEPPRAIGADSFVDRRALMGAEIVHDEVVGALAPFGVLAVELHEPAG
jgi:hypothetical protein